MSSSTTLTAPQIYCVERLVERILEKGCIPFLGAGISYDAQIASGEMLLRTSEMTARLVNYIKEHCANHKRPDRCTCDNSVCKQVTTEIQSLSEVAELCVRTHKAVEACDAIKLADFPNCAPTIAHRYLAALAREGLVDEVLQTNYDTLTEKAYGETFPDETERSRHFVIHSLESYREFGGNLGKATEPNLRIVKLCGCAEQYRQAVDDKQGAAKAIILTESQLQRWRERQWARDLLRDRLRSRALLFIGFGSQDPIVRHHTVQVTEEFSGSESNPGNGKDPWDKPNAPFLLTDETAVRFPQFQLMAAYYQAHNTEVVGDVAELQDKALANVVTNLTADPFLKEVVVRTMNRLVRDRYLSENSAAHSYLLAVLESGVNLLESAATALLGSKEAGGPFAEWLEFTQAADGSGRVQSLWGQVGTAMKGHNPADEGRYQPFLESPIKLPMLLIVIYLVMDTVGRMDRPQPLAGLVRISDGRHKGRMVFACDCDSYDQWEGSVDPDDLPDHSIAVGLGAGNREAELRQVRLRKKGHMNIKRVYIVPDLGLISDRSARRRTVDLAKKRAIAVGEAASWRDHCEGVGHE